VSTLVVLGVSHRTAPLAVRERLALDEDGVRALLRELRGHPAVAEALVLSTCNRTEVYLVPAGPTAAAEAAAPAALGAFGFRHAGEEAARHLFRVVAGLDSMVVGETEIRRQARRAVELARFEGAAGPVVRALARDALAAGRRVRRETGVARGSVSISSVAVELARRSLGGLEGRRALLIGAGKAAERTAQALLYRGASSVVVANRSLEAACLVARRFGGRAVGLEALRSELERADVAICSTSAPHAVLTAADLAPILARRAGRPLTIVDIAVPRDVEPRARALAGLALHDLDDLEALAAANRAAREREARRAEAIVAEALRRRAAPGRAPARAAV
jgi:glutamyl-tRNA reductase